MVPKIHYLPILQAVNIWEVRFSRKDNLGYLIEARTLEICSSMTEWNQWGICASICPPVSSYDQI